MALFYVIFSHFDIYFIENIINRNFQIFTFNRLGYILYYYHCTKNEVFH